MDVFLNFWSSESSVRLQWFASVLLVMALAELFAPRRRLTSPKRIRWLSNLALVALNASLLRILLPLGATGFAMVAQQRGWGVLNVVTIPGWAAMLISLVLLDFAIYLQHVVFHAVPALWRLHMVHHADLDFDVSTGLRFHTIEIFLSMLLKVAVVFALGAPPMAVVVFEVLLNATAMFSHSNVRLPLRLDRLLRLVIVTPDMHRVHHSATTDETNSNFGFHLAWWDLLLGTYRAQPADGHEHMTIGLAQLRDERVIRLHWMLVLPLLRGATGPREPARQNDEPDSFGRVLSSPETVRAVRPHPSYAATRRTVL